MYGVRILSVIFFFFFFLRSVPVDAAEQRITAGSEIVVFSSSSVSGSDSDSIQPQPTGIRSKKRQVA